jgi:hypothetical protein
VVLDAGVNGQHQPNYDEHTAKEDAEGDLIEEATCVVSELLRQALILISSPAFAHRPTRPS